MDKPQPDLTKGIMDRVVQYERRRSRGWLGAYIVGGAALGAIGLLSLIGAVLHMEEHGSFSALAIFTEDREVVAALWRDALRVFWDSLPHHRLLVTLIALTALIALVQFTRTRRRLLQKRLDSMSGYQPPKK